ncbi:MAG: insulinase family protein [Hellea sp.]|nr:insulinase family protein [Hellea sp.]
MMKKFLVSACVAILLTACSGNNADVEGIKLVETVERRGDEIIIPFKKFELENGLTIILHEDKSDPLVHVDVTYHVGSGREDIGKSGFAHFFEHMLFQGSENVADEEHFKIITEAGGTLNGSTNSDRTNYYETVPSNQLEKMLWLEADRMGYFLNAVTQEKFEVQRETVKNERGQRVDNRPYGLLWERVGEAMFPEGHPYSWSTIGYLEDLDRATLDDLKKFFLEWYGPNNAVITIGGDFDEAQTLEWIEKYFGPIPAGPDVGEPKYEPVTLDADRYISLEDKVAIPLLYMAWPTVNRNHEDEAPLDVLMSIMGQGKTSLLYKNLEKDGLAVNTSAGHNCRELSCEFTLLVMPNPAKGNSLSDMENILRDSLNEFEKRGVEDDDLIRVKANIVSDKIYGLESVSGKIRSLAAYETLDGDANRIGADIKRYEAITKADVTRVYEQYIKGKPAVIMSIVPEGKADLIAKPDTWQRYERTIPASLPANVNWSLPQDDFDRSIIPSAGANPTIKVPPIYEAVLNNGIKVMGAVNSETPTTTISIRLKAGQNQERLENLGAASMTAAMLNEATLDSTVEELSNRLDKLGSNVSISAGDDYTTVYVKTLTKNLDETIAIVAEKIFKPKFAKADFERLQQQTIQNIRASKKQPAGVATEIFNRKLFGDKNAFAWPNSGTEDSVANMKLADVRRFYRANYSAEIAEIIAVSDLDEADVMKSLATFSSWEAKPVRLKKAKPFPKLEVGTLYFIDKPGAAQSEIRIGKRSLPYDSTGEQYRLGLMNYALGGAFNSRINLNLREDKGYTYGARGFFNGSEDRGFYRASSGVRTDATAASVKEFVKEIKKYQAKGITEEELSFTKSAIGQSDARSYETPRQKLGFLGRMMTYDLDPSFVDEQNAILADISKAEIDALAKKHLRLGQMIMVVVGDKAAVYDDLVELGYPIVELDEDGFGR